MRNSFMKSSRKKNRVATAALKIFALAFCFALTFGIALTGDLWLPDGLNGTPSNGNVAEAVASGGSTDNDIVGDHGNFRSSVFEKSENNISTFTETFGSTDFFNSNAVGTYATNGNTTPYDIYNDGPGMISLFRNVYAFNGEGNLYVMVNYGMPDFLKNLIAGGTTVYAQMTATLDLRNSRTGNRTGLNLFTSNSRMNARYKNSQDGDYPSQGGETSTLTCNKVAITAAAPYLGLGFMSGHAGPAVNGTDRCKISEINIKFSIPSSDGLGPVLVGYNKDFNLSSAECRPYRPSNVNESVSNGSFAKNNALWPVYYENNDTFIDKLPLDNLFVDVDRSGNLIKPLETAKLLSYTNTSFLIDGMNCYKSLTMSFRDRFSGEATAALGISRIVVGETTNGVGELIADSAYFDFEDIQIANVSDYKTIYFIDPATGALSQGGKVRVGRVSNDSCYIELSFSQNANFKVGVSDFGTGSFYKTLDVSGIDETAPTMVNFEAPDENIITVNIKEIDKLRWLLKEQLVLSALDETANNEDKTSGMWLWYYTVGYSNASFDDIHSNPYTGGSFIGDLKPFSIDKLRTTYNFKTGEMTSNYKHGIEAAPHNGGYYKFTFYVADAAGNFAINKDGKDYIDYYVKVDADDVKYEIGSEKGTNNIYYDFNGSKKSIYRSSEYGTLINGAWANGALTVKLFLSAPSISGNYLTFSSPDGSNTLLFNGGQLSHILAGDTLTEITGNMYTLIYEYSDGYLATIDIEYDPETYSLKLIFGTTPLDGTGDSSYPEYDYALTLEYGVCGEVDRIGDGNSYSQTKVDEGDFDYWDYEGTDGKRKAGVCIRVDRNAPDESTLVQKGDNGDLKNLIQNTDPNAKNEGVYITKDGAVYVYDEKNWFTDKTGLYAATLQCLEKISGRSATINVGITLNRFLDRQYETSYKTMPQTEYSKMFDQGRFYSFEKSDNDTFDAEFNLLGQGADKVGLRAFYVWTTDQAGNVSDLTRYYVLSDPSVYTYKTKVEHPVSGTNGSVVMNDGKTEKFFRGQNVDFKFTFGEGFAPYKFSVGTIAGETEGKTTLQMLTNNIPSSINNAGGYGNCFAWVNKEVQTKNTVLSPDGLTLSIKTEYPGEDVRKPVYADTFESLIYTLSYRKIININSIVQTAQYNGGDPVVIQYPINDSSAKEFVKFVYYAENGNLIETPTYVPGEFKVLPALKGDKIFVDGVFDGEYGEENTKYVLDNAHWEKTPFTITNRNATVVADGGISEYGNPIKLTYTFENLSEKDLASWGNGQLGEDIVLKLNSVTDNTKAHVGTYDIVLAGKMSLKCYNLTFKGAQHRIQPRAIKASIDTAHQYYKDGETTITFRVDTNQFVNGDAWDDVFLNAALDGNAGNTVVLRGANENLIQHKTGASVGSYAYILDNIDRFNLNPDYTVALQAGDGVSYIIDKKEVSIFGKPGQSVVAEAGTEINDEYLGKLQFDYIFGNEAHKALYGNEIYLKFISAGTQVGEVDRSDPNYDIYTFNFDFSGFNNTGNYSNNITVIANAGTFVIKVLKAEANIDITISLKNEIIKYFGQSRIDVENSIVFNTDDFNVQDNSKVLEGYDGYTITWDAAVIGNASIKYLSPGVYAVEISNVVIKNKDGEQILTEAFVEVQEFTVTYKPCEVSIVPEITASFRTYGQSDSAYGLKYRIEYPSWFPVEELSNELINDNEISGSFARAVFDNTGREIRRGSIFDSATNADGSVINGNGNYYGVSVGSAFTITNSVKQGEFTLKTDVSSVKGTKLLINRAKIIIIRENFIGISKNYDGTDLADYGDVKAYNFELVNPTDDVTLSFVARYNGKTPGPRPITFSELSLRGLDISNYVLCEENGTEIVDQTFTISYIVNNDVDNQVKIEIRKVTLYKAHKSDFEIKKEYDGTTGVNADSVRIIPQNPLSTVSAKNLVSKHAFDTADVTSFYSLGKVVLFFNIPNPQNNWDISVADGETDIVIEYVNSDDSEGGIKITLSNMFGSITQKKIRPTDMVSDTDNKVRAVDREYNATPDVTILATPKAGVIPGADEGKIAFSFKGTTAEGDNQNMNAGTHKVSFTTAKINAKDGAKGNNYSIDVAEFDNYFKGARQLNVKIAKVKIIPNFTFSKKTYDGVNNVSIKKDDVALDTTHIIAMNPESRTEELSKELGKLRINRNDLMGDNVFNYSRTIVDKNGKRQVVPYAGVQFDANGNIVKHDVMVENLVITLSGDGIITAGIAENYEIPGSDWDGVAKDGKISIATYAMPNVAELNQKDVTIVPANAVVSDKIYDGTDKVKIEIPITGNESENQNIVASDKEYVQFYFKSRFNSANVNYSNGTVVKQNVTVDGTKFIDSKEGDYSFDANDSVEFIKRAGNYNLVGKNSTFTSEAYIYPAPLTVTDINLGEKQYDGTFAVQKNGSLGGIKYNLTKRSDSGDKTLPGLIGSDAGIYTINIGSAGYVCKNVKLDENNNVIAKPGNVFNLIVNNSQNQMAINYALTETSVVYDEARANEIIAVLVGNEFVPYVPGTTQQQDVELWCYALPVVNYVIEAVAVDTYLKTVKNDDGSYWNVNDYRTAYGKTSENNEPDSRLIFGELVGGRVINGKGYYVIGNGDATYKVGTVTYKAKSEVDGRSVHTNVMTAAGKIDCKTISVKVQQKVNPAGNPFTKNYDGTNVFYGQANVDFEVDITNTLGIIAGDEVIIGNGARGSFAKISAGPNQVEFVVTSITGKDAYNYRVSSDNTTKLSGYINKVDINATLNDHSVDYGFDSIGQKYTDVNYVYHYDNTTYYGYDASGKLIKKTGTKGSATLKVMLNAADERYCLYMEETAVAAAFPLVCEIGGMTLYVDRNGTAEVATEEDAGKTKYIQLYGGFTFPTVSPEKGANGNSQCGQYKLAFINNGLAGNFTFITDYGTDKDSKPRDNAVLTINKVHIYVYANSNKTAGNSLDAYYLFERFYGQDNPEMSLAFGDKNGEFGFKNSDTYLSVFGNIAGNLLPKAEFVKFDSSGNVIDTYKVAPNSLISSGLNEGEYYGVHINIANLDVLNNALTNYVVEIAYGNTDVSDAGSVIKNVAKLDITLPEITNVTAKDYTQTFTGGNLVKDNDDLKNMFSGIGENIDKTGVSGKNTVVNWYVNGNDSGYAIDSGKYSVRVFVQREFPGLPNEEGAIYRTEAEEYSAVLTINKAVLGINADNVTWDVGDSGEGKVFDETKLKFNFNKKTDNSKESVETPPVGVNYGDISIITWVEDTYKKGANAGRKYYRQLNADEKMLHAGTYKITFTYKGSSNYEAEGRTDVTADDKDVNTYTNYAIYIVNPYEINITVSSADKRKAIVNGVVPTLKYTVDWGTSFTDEVKPGIEVKFLGAFDGNGNQTYVDITRSGKYTYQIMLVPDTANKQDYYLSGDASGQFVVGITSQESSSKNALLKSENGKILLVDNILYKEIFEGSSEYGDSDYWNRIAQYTEAIGGKGATLKSVVRLSAQYGGNKVATGNVTMTVKVPSSVKSMKNVEVYGVTADGGLTRLNYTFANGKITYATDNVDSIAFIQLGSAIPDWGIVLIVIGSLILAIFCALIAAFFIVMNKRKRQWIALAGNNLLPAPMEKNTKLTDVRPDTAEIYPGVQDVGYGNSDIYNPESNVGQNDGPDNTDSI